MNTKEYHEVKSKVRVLKLLSQIHFFVGQYRAIKYRKLAGNNGDLRIKYYFVLMVVI